jgi:hypothetical protein
MVLNLKRLFEQYVCTLAIGGTSLTNEEIKSCPVSFLSALRGLCLVGSDQVDGFHAGGLIIFNPNATQHLPAAANAAFLATLYADYLKAADVPVVECGPNWFSPDVLRNFSRTQVHIPNFSYLGLRTQWLCWMCFEFLSC